jgi:predicted PurR-regulated permease PerM
MTQQKTWFWLTLLIIASTLYALSTLSAILFPFLMGAIGAYGLSGIVDRLEKLKISRGLSSALLILAVILILLLLMMVFIPFLHNQLINLASRVPALMEDWYVSIKPFLEKSAHELGTPNPAEIKAQVTSHIGDIITWSIRIITNLFTNGMALANLISLILLTPIIMFYLLKDWPRLIRKIDETLPLTYQPLIRRHAQTMDAMLSAYAQGQGIVCLILMVLYSTSLWAIGLEQGIFIGIITGFMSFIPYIGMISGLLTSIAVTLANALGWAMLIKVIITFVIIGAIEGNYLAPRFIGERIGLHPVWIIFALLAGATWFGFLGILIALPSAAIIGVLVRIILEWYRTSKFYLGRRRDLCPTLNNLP